MIEIQPKLKNLIKICSSNMKGLTKIEDIDKLLPIKTEKLYIEKQERKIVIRNQEKIIGTVWESVGCYSNLEILKIITKEYNIEPKNERIISLMKYKYIIDNILM